MTSLIFAMDDEISSLLERFFIILLKWVLGTNQQFSQTDKNTGSELNFLDYLTVTICLGLGSGPTIDHCSVWSTYSDFFVFLFFGVQNRKILNPLFF